MVRAHEQLLAELSGICPGFDDPSGLQRFYRNLEPEDLVMECVADLSPSDRRALLEAFEGDWSALLVCHVGHPSLQHLVAYGHRHPEVIVLATPSGPVPPAVLVLEAKER